MALKDIAAEGANIRQKRSPASLFGFNLGNPVSTAGDTFNSVGNIFSGNRANTHQDNYHEQRYRQPYDRNTNSFPPTRISNRNGIPNSIARDNFQQRDRYVSPQENKSEDFKKAVPDRKQNSNTKPLPVTNNEIPKNTSENPENEKVNKELLNYIFQKPEFNEDDAGTTVDNNIDVVTETGEYETVSRYNRIYKIFYIIYKYYYYILLLLLYIIEYIKYSFIYNI